MPGCRLSGAVCGLWKPPDSALPRAAASGSRTPSPRASEAQPGGRVATGALGYTRPCRAAGKALLSPVEIKHRMGMGREGVWQQPAAGSGRGLGGGVSCARPGVLDVQLLPLTRAYIQRRRQSSVPRPAAARTLRSPCWGERAAACGPGHAPGNTVSWAGLPGRGARGLSLFTLFREYEFTCKSRGWAPSRPPGPLAVETGSRSCTKWEWGGVRDPEQPARGVTGCAFGWESAGQESWGCRNLLKTPRLFFP